MEPGGPPIKILPHLSQAEAPWRSDCLASKLSLSGGQDLNKSLWVPENKTKSPGRTWGELFKQGCCFFFLGNLGHCKIELSCLWPLCSVSLSMICPQPR